MNNEVVQAWQRPDFPAVPRADVSELPGLPAPLEQKLTDRRLLLGLIRDCQDRQSTRFGVLSDVECDALERVIVQSR